MLLSHGNSKCMKKGRELNSNSQQLPSNTFFYVPSDASFELPISLMEISALTKYLIGNAVLHILYSLAK